MFQAHGEKNSNSHRMLSRKKPTCTNGLRIIESRRRVHSFQTHETAFGGKGLVVPQY